MGVKISMAASYKRIHDTIAASPKLTEVVSRAGAGTSRREQTRKPANLVYGVDDAPPLPVLVVLALQHVLVLSVGWIFVVVFITSIGGTSSQSQAIIRISMLCSGLATILQARTKGPVGSGFFCPLSCGPAYLPAAILAGKTGGLPLVFGLTAVSGVFESALSRVMRRLRVLFPPEVTGLVVSLVGIELVGVACTRFVGFNGNAGNARSLLTASITLVAMIVPTVWAKSKIRLFPVLLGLGAGYATSAALGLINVTQVRSAMLAPLLGIPVRVPGWGLAFDKRLLLPFIIASISSMLKTVGDLTLCQKINDADWKRTDMKSVPGGILAGSISTAIAGLAGGLGQSTFSSNVGLSLATGATSRMIALPTGVLLVALAFLPKVAAAFALVPAPVMGAVLVYVACFMIVGGLQVVTSRMLDTRRIFVVGLALIFGLSVEMVPGVYRDIPQVLRPLFSSSLALGTLLVVFLNAIFRIGISQVRRFEFTPATYTLDGMTSQMEEQGAVWGMRKEVVRRAIEIVHELSCALNAVSAEAPVILELKFDELKLSVDVAYIGPQLDFPVLPPTCDLLARDSRAVPMLAGYLIRRYADDLRFSSDGHRSRVHVGLEH